MCPHTQCLKKGREKNREEHSGLFKGKVKSSILHRVMTPLLNPSAMALSRSALLLTPVLPFSSPFWLSVSCRVSVSPDPVQR